MAAFAEAVRDKARAGLPLRRPEQARDVVGEDLERLLIVHGYLAPEALEGDG